MTRKKEPEKTDKKEKDPAATGSNNDLKLFSNKSITDRTEFVNILFKNLSGLLEIREIKNGQVKQKFLNSWEDIESYDPPADKNVYIGMLTRKKKSGKRQDCKHTKVLWVDYDNMSQIEVEYRIDNAGLPGPSIIINSGHGIHCYWLLDEPAGSEVEPVVKAIANKTEADGQATDIARVMRLPGTMNVKDDPVKCEIIEKNNKIYSLEDIAEVLEVELKQPQEKATAGQNKPDINYQGIISKVDRPCIKSMLEGVGEGERNFAAGRLIMYFRNIKGYSKRKTKKIIQYWNTLNDPPENERKLLNDFKNYWHSDYNLLGCYIPDNTSKQQILDKHCNKNKCSISGQFKVKENRRMSRYNNRIIKRIKKLHGTALIVYGILEKHPEGLTRKRILEIVDISEMTFYKRIKELLNIGFVFKRKGNRRRGIPNLYKVVKQGTYGTGRTSVSYGAVIAAANNVISPAQFKVYLLLHWYLYIGQTNDIYPSTFTLAEKLGKSQSTIQNHITALNEKDFIQVDKTKEGYNIYYLQV
ncbi:MAG: helix-turn-helix domain-containing protein [bacterium]